jgi:hypothetical protein
MRPPGRLRKCVNVAVPFALVGWFLLTVPNLLGPGLRPAFLFGDAPPQATHFFGGSKSTFMFVTPAREPAEAARPVPPIPPAE